MYAYNFYIDKEKVEKSIIICDIRLNGERKRFSSGISIPTNLWDKKRKTIKSCKDNQLLIEKYEILRSIVIEELRNADRDNSTMAECVGAIYERFFQNGSKVNSASLVEFYKYWATHSWDIGSSKRHVPNRQITYTYKIFYGFCNGSMTFKEMTYDKYLEFIDYLRDVKKLATNTVGTHCKNIKAVMNDAYKRGMHKNTSYLQFVKPSEEVFNIYLTMDEISLLWNLKLNSREEKVRDIFVFGCYTGLRFSDFSKVKKENIINDNILYIKQQKTKTDVMIPLHPRAMQIVEKYNGVPTLTDVEINRTIKKVCRRAGITQPIPIYKDGKMVLVEKCDLVKTHTCRRSAATNMYLAQIPTISIMKITGHRTERSFLKYVKISIEENAKLLSNHKFFKE